MIDAAQESPGDPPRPGIFPFRRLGSVLIAGMVDASIAAQLLATPCSGGGSRAAVRQLCKSVVNVDAWEDPVGTVRAYIEYGWNLNPEIGFKTTKSEVHNSITIDGIDMLPTVVLVELAR